MEQLVQSIQQAIELTERSLQICKGYMAGVKTRLENPRPLLLPTGQAIPVNGPTDLQIFYNLIDSNIVLLVATRAVLLSVRTLLDVKDEET